MALGTTPIDAANTGFLFEPVAAGGTTGYLLDALTVSCSGNLADPVTLIAELVFGADPNGGLVYYTSTAVVPQNKTGRYDLTFNFNACAVDGRNPYSVRVRTKDGTPSGVLLNPVAPYGTRAVAENGTAPFTVKFKVSAALYDLTYRVSGRQGFMLAPEFALGIWHAAWVSTSPERDSVAVRVPISADDTPVAPERSNQTIRVLLSQPSHAFYKLDEQNRYIHGFGIPPDLFRQAQTANLRQILRDLRENWVAENDADNDGEVDADAPPLPSPDPDTWDGRWYVHQVVGFYLQDPWGNPWDSTADFPEGFGT